MHSELSWWSVITKLSRWIFSVYSPVSNWSSNMGFGTRLKCLKCRQSSPIRTLSSLSPLSCPANELNRSEYIVWHLGIGVCSSPLTRSIKPDTKRISMSSVRYSFPYIIFFSIQYSWAVRSVQKTYCPYKNEPWVWRLYNPFNCCEIGIAPTKKVSRICINDSHLFGVGSRLGKIA